MAKRSRAAKRRQAEAEAAELAAAALEISNSLFNCTFNFILSKYHVMHQLSKYHVMHHCAMI